MDAQRSKWDCTMKKHGRKKSPASKNVADAFTTIVEIVPFDRNWIKPWFEWKIGSGARSEICVASTQIDILMSFPSWFDLSLTSCWWGTYKYIDERSEANESAFAEVARPFCLGSVRVDALMSFSIFVRPLWSANMMGLRLMFYGNVWNLISCCLRTLVCLAWIGLDLLAGIVFPSF